MSVRTETTGDGIRYIATASGKTYRSLHYHRSLGGRKKTIWSISRWDEFLVFSTADDRNWHDQKGYWSFRNGTRDELGKDGSRIAFFPEKARPADDWHGFPLHLSPVQRPDVQLAKLWVAAQEIGFAVGEKIKRGKL